MKKLIAIGVVFVLVAGAAFAATQVSVDVAATITFVESTSAKFANGMDGSGNPKYKDDTLRTGGSNHTAQISASSENEAKTIGGKFKLVSQGYTNSNGYGDNGGSNNTRVWGWVWWRPIEIIKVQIGTNAGDGEFEPDNSGAWGFYQGNDVIVPAGLAWYGWYGRNGLYTQAGPTTGPNQVGILYRDAWYSGYNDGGLVLNIGPFSGLSINVGIPFWGQYNSTWGGNTLEGAFKHMHAQVAFNIDNVGKLALTIRGNNTTPNGLADEPQLFLNFNLTAIEGVGLSVAVGYMLPDLNGTESVTIGGVTADAVVSRYNPLNIGLAASFGSGAVGFKIRTIMGIGGSKKYEVNDSTLKSSYTDPDPFMMLLDILPSYQINDTAVVKMSAGIGIRGEDEMISPTTGDLVVAAGGDLRVFWHVFPYVVLTGVGGGSVHFGFRLEGNNTETDARGDNFVKWSIPFAIKFSF
jgi:hypothetical protein